MDEKIIIKRDGRAEPFNFNKIKCALDAAFTAVKGTNCPKEVIVYAEFLTSACKTVEEIQDAVEVALMSKQYYDVAKSYILYRELHKNIRNFVSEKKKYISNFAKSNNTANATIDDNSNVATHNIANLNTEIHKEDNIKISRGMVMDKLKELYPEFNCKQYLDDLNSHIIYKHDESSFAGAIAPYCVSITMYPFLLGGIKNIGGLSAAPKNIDSYCGMFCNLIFAISAQYAGAVATSEFLLYFTYFAKKEWGEDFFKNADSFSKIGYKLRKLLNESHYWCNDIKELRLHDFGSLELNSLRDEIVKDATRELTEEEKQEYYEGVKENPEYTLNIGDGTRTIASQIAQYFQQVIYTINQPAAARGYQSAFVNFSYFDKSFFDGMFKDFMFPDGAQPDWESLCWMQKVFMKWFNQERLRTIITFPVESSTLLYKNHEFSDSKAFDFVCEEYARGHSFFTYISDTVDSLSSCCRLKNKIQTKEFNFTNGNIGVQTGSKSVITLNLSRIIQDWFNKSNTFKCGKFNVTTQPDYFYDELSGFGVYLNSILERVHKYHVAYNELLWDMYDANLLPVYKARFIHLDKQYLTIGINGLNEAAEFVGLECSDNRDYQKFCQTIFSTIKDFNTEHKGKVNGHQITLNTECVPAESLAIKNYNWDKADGYWVPENRNLYASYIFIPSDPDRDIFEKIRMHGKNFIGDYLDGGSACHLNLSEHLTKEQYAHILKYAAEHGCQYLTFNIPNCECDDCGFIAKQPFDVCPKCGSTHISLWDRIIGYLTKVKNWSAGRQIEQKTRIYMSIKSLKEESKEKFLERPGATEELYNALHNSKSGYITISRLSDGKGDQGYTEAFGEGLSCHIDNPDTWYTTSTIKKIDWEKGEFETLNSTYKFTFKEDTENA